MKERHTLQPGTSQVPGLDYGRGLWDTKASPRFSTIWDAKRETTMNLGTRTLASVFCFTLLTAASLTMHAADDEGDFAPLFNGRDLSGWVPINVAPNTFSVRDGIIVSSGIPTGLLRTERQYENFIIELEWRHMKTGRKRGAVRLGRRPCGAGFAVRSRHGGADPGQRFQCQRARTSGTRRTATCSRFSARR